MTLHSRYKPRRTYEMLLISALSNLQYRNTNMIVGKARNIRNEITLLRTDILSAKKGYGIKINTEAKIDKVVSRYPLQASPLELVIETRYKPFLDTLRIRQLETTLSFGKVHEHQAQKSSTQSRTTRYFLPTYLFRCIAMQ